ncbi:unnamed protein product [Orchesella dallaii]|uniref:Uncharacterized protein n=1 Tax=Orchesella dallaii TaxID=48710 RepID=A0ABP1RPP0_9HEXA
MFTQYFLKALKSYNIIFTRPLATCAICFKPPDFRTLHHVSNHRELVWWYLTLLMMTYIGVPYPIYKTFQILSQANNNSQIFTYVLLIMLGTVGTAVFGSIWLLIRVRKEFVNAVNKLSCLSDKLEYCYPLTTRNVKKANSVFWLMEDLVANTGVWTCAAFAPIVSYELVNRDRDPIQLVIGIADPSVSFYVFRFSIAFICVIEFYRLITGALTFYGGGQSKKVYDEEVRNGIPIAGLYNAGKDVFEEDKVSNAHKC